MAYLYGMQKAIIGERSFQIEDSGKLTIDGKEFPVDMLEYKKGRFHIIVDNKSYHAEVLSVDAKSKTCQLKIGQKTVQIEIRDQYDELLREMGIDVKAGSKVNEIKAPMPGMVLQVMVENGQPIKKGDAIVVLEAMKMENILKSPTDGTVKKIHVNRGDKVEKNQVMVNLD